jgi:hypothetical protein
VIRKLSLARCCLFGCAHCVEVCKYSASAYSPCTLPSVPLSLQLCNTAPWPLRCCSRLAGRRVVFQPYSRDQLNEIIKSRLGAQTCWQQHCSTLTHKGCPAPVSVWLLSVPPTHVLRSTDAAGVYWVLPVLCRGAGCLPTQRPGVHFSQSCKLLGRCAALSGAVPTVGGSPSVCLQSSLCLRKEKRKFAIRSLLACKYGALLELCNRMCGRARPESVSSCHSTCVLGCVYSCLQCCRAAEIAEDKQHRQQQQQQQRAGPGSSGGANDSTLQQERGMVEVRGGICLAQPSCALIQPGAVPETQVPKPSPYVPNPVPSPPTS